MSICSTVSCAEAPEATVSATVGHHQVEGRHSQFLQLTHVVGVAAVGQQAGVDVRVQGLHASVQALREAGDLLDTGDRHPAVGDDCGGRSGGDDLHATGVQRPRQFR